jgi:hypothetical protein
VRAVPTGDPECPKQSSHSASRRWRPDLDAVRQTAEARSILALATPIALVALVNMAMSVTDTVMPERSDRWIASAWLSASVGGTARSAKLPCDVACRVAEGRAGLLRHLQRHRLHAGGDTCTQSCDVAGWCVAATVSDEPEPLDESRRRRVYAAAHRLLGIVVLGRQDDEPRKRAVGDVGGLKQVPEVQRRRGAVDAEAGLHDVAALVAPVVVGVLRSEEDAAGAVLPRPGLRLTLLALEIVEAILDGRQSAELQLDDLLAGLPLEWARQNECRASMVATGRDDRFDDI